jgi:hypothetical protein
VNILKALDEAELFGKTFKRGPLRGDSYRNWKVFLSGLFGLPLIGDAPEAFRKYTGRTELPTAAFSECWCICGRRSGKSLIAAATAIYLAAFRDYEQFRAPGETLVLPIIAPDRRQCRVILSYVNGFLDASPTLSTMVRNRLKESIELTNGVRIETHTANFRTVRGYTAIGAILDEAAFLRSDDSASPDTELLAAVRPALASIPCAVLLAISSPYARKGEVWNNFREHYGKVSPILVWRAPSRSMNPTLSRFVVETALLRDRAAASSEYLAEFRDDIGGFLSIEEIERAVVRGRTLLPYVEGLKYKAFCDPSGGRNDSTVLAVAHAEKDRAVLDLIREIRAPFSPQQAVSEFCALLRAYHISEVRGDRYKGGWVQEAFERNRVRYVASDRNRSEIYLEFLPALTSGQIELLDNERMKNQFAALERRTGAARDMIDHPVGGADDVANAAAGAVVLALPSVQGVLGVIEYGKAVASGKYPNPLQSPSPATAMKLIEPNRDGTPSVPQDGLCPECRSTCVIKLFARQHCNSCGIDFGPLPEVAHVKRSDVLGGHYPVTRR